MTAEGEVPQRRCFLSFLTVKDGHCPNLSQAVWTDRGHDRYHERTLLITRPDLR